MFFAVTGHSEDVDTISAVEEIKEQCEEGLADRKPKAGILFAAIDSEHEELLQAVNSVWPGIELMGCSTDGELSSVQGFLEDSITLTLFGSDVIDMTVGVGRNAGQDVPAACRLAVSEARAKTKLEPGLCLAVPESLTSSGEQVVKMLNAELGGDIPLFGGTAGDQWRFQGTHQYVGSEVLADAIPVMLFSGPLHYSFGCASGWKPVGQPGTITRSEINVVHEIEGAPAIEFYRKYLGPEAKPGGECPLGVLNKNGEIEYLRATGGIVDEQTGAITFFADIPQGASVQVTVADRDAILNGCRESVQMAVNNYPQGKTPEGALFFSCSGRRLLLGTKVSEEAKLINSTANLAIPFCGFYGYGEISPTKDDATDSKFHNQTFVSLLIGS